MRAPPCAWQCQISSAIGFPSACGMDAPSMAANVGAWSMTYPCASVTFVFPVGVAHDQAGLRALFRAVAVRAGAAAVVRPRKGGQHLALQVRYKARVAVRFQYKS